jgi:cardiolipin synthase
MTEPATPPSGTGPGRDGPPRFWNVPNTLTSLRIALIPVFAALMVGRRPKAAFLVFLVAAVTDVLDGLAARAWHQRTKIGYILDPAADKLMMTAAFVLLALPALARPNVLPLWLVALAIGRDLAIVLAAYLLYRLRGIKTFPPSLFGKASTVCQVLMVWLVLIANVLDVAAPNLSWVYILTAALAVVSGVDYAIKGWRKLFPRGEA